MVLIIHPMQQFSNDAGSETVILPWQPGVAGNSFDVWPVEGF
jgi:hypothetical protein